MATPSSTVRLYATSGVLAATLFAGCSDSTVNPLSSESPAPTPLVSLMATGPIIGEAGSAFGAFDANVSGRATTEFWDNSSADFASVPNQCNIGFYAEGMLQPDCIPANVKPGTYATQGGFSQMFFDAGGAAGAQDATAFMFDGNEIFDVKLTGGIRGEDSEVGYYTKSAGVYSFTPVPAWNDASTANDQIQINTGGANWGFYIKNGYIDAASGCAPMTACTDATGSFVAGPFQQFALFTDAGHTRYMVGAEDNKINIILGQPGAGAQDADYQDYIWQIDPARVGGQGCSPGYWKNHEDWPAPYTQGTLYSAVFDDAFPGMTLQQVLSTGGGGLTALGRHTVSALLNAAALGTNYELSPLQVINKFNAVFPGSNTAYNTLKAEFEALQDVNGRICPLN
jgi:hypothetical protein